MNGKTGILFIIKTGSGQGDPISSILFLISTEPLNRALVQQTAHIMYKTINNHSFGGFFFADDNLAGLNIRSPQDLQIMQSVYAQYTRVSGLNINISKSTALCSNTDPEITKCYKIIKWLAGMASSLH